MKFAKVDNKCLNMIAINSANLVGFVRAGNKRHTFACGGKRISVNSHNIPAGKENLACLVLIQTMGHTVVP